jgi:hypothetical protein
MHFNYIWKCPKDRNIVIFSPAFFNIIVAFKYRGIGIIYTNYHQTIKKDK